MLAIKCHCPEEPYLPLMVTFLRNKLPFTFTHCVFCGKNITWMNIPEEKIKKDADVREISEGEILPEEMKWYEKKLQKGLKKKENQG